MRARWWGAILGGLCLPAAALASPPAAIWFGESLFCHQDGGVGGCELWLDPDGRYSVFYDRGRPAIPTGAAGPFRFASRTGRYAASATVGGITLCLRPDPLAADASPDDGSLALFRERGCLTLAVRPIGESYQMRFAGSSYTLVLAQGR